MALGAANNRTGKGARRRKPRLVVALLALSSASCVPIVAERPAAIIDVAAAPADAPATGWAAPLPSDPVPGQVYGLQDLAGTSVQAFRGRTALDDLRSLDCLAQAIYYEAATESEDGQRAVAQVVLNRVRHPAWPNSVCGVVYQGPMRPGGGCQFTFTCDGSLMRRPAGLAWARARMLAAEALAGRAFEPVGQSTHYHTNYVSPPWAPRLQPTTVIGAHLFYRLPGPLGETSAFTDAYSGSEPLPRPAMTLLRRPTPAGGASSFAFGPTARARFAPVVPPSDIPQDPRWVASDLPPSTVRDEYLNSGQWRSDAPAAITGR